jgi:heme/copper-type cytochrome/quinol oxidase subunit 2
MALVPSRPSRGRMMVLCLIVLAFAGYRAAPGADGLAPPPERTIDLAVSHAGFVPSTIEARKGETLHLHLESRDDEHCFAMEAFRIEKRVVRGRTTAVDVTPDRTGTFPFYCCLESGKAAERERGKLVVGE